MLRSNSFRIGKVTGYLRGRVSDQLESGAQSSFSFEPLAVAALRDRWLEHHEQVWRSSVQSIARYRTATDHLLRYLAVHPVRHAGQFTATHAAALVGHLRTMRVSPNGHANTPKRPLLDKGVRYVLECCRALFNYAAKRRHLPPYADNPFAAIEIDRIPVETARPVELLTAEQERTFLGACDDWQFPVFLTLLLTGLRPGELCHLLLPRRPRLGRRGGTGAEQAAARVAGEDAQPARCPACPRAGGCVPGPPRGSRRWSRVSAAEMDQRPTRDRYALRLGPRTGIDAPVHRVGRDPR